MSRYLKIFLIFMAIWAVASLINGILSGICIAVNEGGVRTDILGDMVLGVVCSFIFGAPLVGLTWLVTSVAQCDKKTGLALFKVSFLSALLFAFIGAFAFVTTLGKEFKEVNYFMGISIIFSAASSILLFRKKIKTDG